MADHPSTEDRVQSKGREANDAQPLNAAKDNGGPERYPPARKDDAVEQVEPRNSESRTFNPQPRQGAGDSSVTDGRMGAGADPAEGKR